MSRIEGAPDLAAVWSDGADAWAPSKGGTVWRRAGGTWSVEKIPILVDFVTVSGTSASDVWVGGTAGGLARWDGKGWASIPSESTAGFTGIAAITPDRAAATTEKRYTIWDGDHWDSVVGRPSLKGLRAVAPLGKGGFVAVGDGGLVAEADAKSKKWTRTTARGDLTAVVSCGQDVIALGDVTLRRGKKGWSDLAAPPAPVQAAVARCKGGKVAAVAAIAGDSVHILEVAKDTWRSEVVETGATLRGIAAQGKGLIVVGDKGLVATRASW